MRPKLMPVKVGLLIGVSISGNLYIQRATQYSIDSARINSRKGAPLGYVGAWKMCRDVTQNELLRVQAQKVGLHRDVIRDKFKSWGVRFLKELPQTRYREYYRFLNSLKP